MKDLCVGKKELECNASECVWEDGTCIVGPCTAYSPSKNQTYPCGEGCVLE
jgi:hypothetical protein